MIGWLMPSGLNLFSVNVCFFQTNISWRKLSLEDLRCLCGAKFSANIPRNYYFVLGNLGLYVNVFRYFGCIKIITAGALPELRV